MNNTIQPSSPSNRVVWITVIIAALGYFVDIYDLLLFSIVRVKSLRDIGIPEDQLLDSGIYLLNMQNLGLFTGGVLWGIWGDKRGRLSVLLGSILLYSVANLVNGFVQDLHTYAALRFFAGLGLAGELGAGVTLACELLPQRYRSYGATLIGMLGLLGAVASALIGQSIDWRHAYILGGVMGLVLLLLRFSLTESTLFRDLESHIPKGAFFRILKTWSVLKRWLIVLGIALPIWFFVGLPVTFAPEFGAALGLTPTPTAANAVLFAYIGFSLGAAALGLYAQLAQSRLKALWAALIMFCAAMGLFYQFGGHSIEAYYAACLFWGFAGGYWILFVQVAAEQFGTNIRATIATSSPNIIRASIIPITMMFQYLKPDYGVLGGSAMIAGATLIVAFWCLLRQQETFHRDLNYIEDLK